MSNLPEPPDLQPSSSSRRWLWLILALGGLGLGAGIFMMFYTEEPAVKQSALEAQPTPPPSYLQPKAKIPRAKSLDPVSFKDPQVRAAYQVAVTAPELLEQMPCYCGCFSAGHSSNYDCFVDNHGVT